MYSEEDVRQIDLVFVVFLPLPYFRVCRCAIEYNILGLCSRSNTCACACVSLRTRILEKTVTALVNNCRTKSLSSAAAVSESIQLHISIYKTTSSTRCTRCFGQFLPYGIFFKKIILNNFNTIFL